MVQKLIIGQQCLTVLVEMAGFWHDGRILIFKKVQMADFSL